MMNDGKGNLREVGAEMGGGFSQPKVGRGLAIGDFDRDGDQDILMTTNNGPAYIFRNDQTAGNRSIRFRLVGTKSKRDAIGARVKVFSSGVMQTRAVRSGSSYLSQSEIPTTFGLWHRDKIEPVVIDWPRGRSEEYSDLSAGRAYGVTDGSGRPADAGF